jgi:hypothetical protein
MADQDFNINIRTTADTAGVRQTQAAIEQLKQQTAAAGAAGGGLESFGSAFGLSAVGVGVALNRAIKAYGDEQVRIAEEAAKHLDLLIASAKKWDDMARAATSMEDVLKLAETATKSVADAQGELLKFQNEGLAGWKEWLDALVTIKGFTSGPFAKAFEDEANRLADNAERIRDSRRRAVEDAKATAAGFDEEKLKPIDEAYADINAKLQEQERLQEQVGTSNIDSYIAIGKQIEIYKAQLKELMDLEKQRKREEEATAQSKQEDVDFWAKQIRGASPQVQRILQNEAAGFTGVAEALKRGATPGQLQELGPLEKAMQENNRILEALLQQWR